MDGEVKGDTVVGWRYNGSTNQMEPVLLEELIPCYQEVIAGIVRQVNEAMEKQQEAGAGSTSS